MKYDSQTIRALEDIINADEKSKARGNVHAAIASLSLGMDDVDKYLLCQGMTSFTAANFKDSDDFGIYWAVPSIVHLYARFKEKLSEKAKSLIEKIMVTFYYVEGFNVINHDCSPYRMFLSENHDSLLKVNLYLIAQLIPHLLVEKLDGLTPTDAHGKLEKYFNNALDEMLGKGWLIEGGEPYNAVTLENYYSLMEFADNEQLRNKAKKFIDVFWVFHAIESINSIRGYAKTRNYSYWHSNNCCWISKLFEIYSGKKTLDISGKINYLCSLDYKPPQEVFEILKYRDEVTPYTVVTKVRGGGYYVLEQRYDDLIHTVPVYYIDNYTQALRTTYMTKHYSVSGYHYPMRMPQTMLMAQNRWEGACFFSPMGSNVGIGVLEKDYSTFDTYVTLHHKNVILYAPSKNAYAHDTSKTPVEILSKENGKYSAHTQLCVYPNGGEFTYEMLDSNTLLGKIENNFFAFLTDGGFEINEDEIIIPTNRGALVVSNRNEKTYEEFVSYIRSLNIDFKKEAIIFSDNQMKLEFNYTDDSDQYKRINGKCINYRTNNYVESPFLNAKTLTQDFILTTCNGKEFHI